MVSGLNIVDKFKQVIIERSCGGMVGLGALGRSLGYTDKPAIQFMKKAVKEFKIDLESERKRFMSKPGYLLRLMGQSREEFLEDMRRQGIITDEKIDLPALRKIAKRFVVDSQYNNHAANMKGFDIEKLCKDFLRRRYRRRRGNLFILVVDFGFPRLINAQFMKKFIEKMDKRLLNIDFEGKAGESCFLDSEGGITTEAAMAKASSTVCCWAGSRANGVVPSALRAETSLTAVAAAGRSVPSASVKPSPMCWNACAGPETTLSGSASARSISTSPRCPSSTATTPIATARPRWRLPATSSSSGQFRRVP